MASGVFSSAAAAGKRELVIKKASKIPEKTAIESGKYDGLFSVTTLNHLQVTGFLEIKELSGRVSQLDQLLQLILTEDGLVSLPEEIGMLSKLKMLDVSKNSISKLPQSFYEMRSLHTLLIGQNNLSDSSFPDLAPDTLERFPNLHHLNLSGNSLTRIPSFVYQSHAIQELYASDNDITVLEPAIGSLVGLKLLELKRNQLKTLPYEVVTCSKLRTIGFEENPISDRRLLKLIAQHGASKPKAVLDYISSHAPKAATPGKTGSGKKSKGKKVASASPRFVDVDSDSEEVVFHESKPKVCVVKPPQFVEVVATSEARKVRQYLVCAVVREVDLLSGENYKNFIALQTKLHDTVCKRRRVAAIATHDLSKLSPPLSYTCLPAEDITFTPLGWSKTVNAKRFLSYLEATKRDKRGGGGGGKKTGGGGAAAGAAKAQDAATVALSKYVQFVNPEGMVNLKDSTGNVVSLAPLTNCENTKIEPSSCDLFLEVSSSDNLASCKSVMDSLVYGMCEGGIGVRGDGVMYVEQARVMDENGQLLVVYPSRTDLTDEKFEVVHP